MYVDGLKINQINCLNYGIRLGKKNPNMQKDLKAGLNARGASVGSGPGHPLTIFDGQQSP